ADIHNSVEADVALDGEVELVSAFDRLVAIDGVGGCWRNRGRSGRLRNTGDGAVVEDRRVNDRRCAAARDAGGGVIVEQAAGSADHHLAVAGGIPSEAQARGQNQAREEVKI